MTRRYDLEFPSIAQIALINAERWPDTVAIIDGDDTITFAGLRERVLHAISACVASGLEPGDRAAIWAPNSAEWIVAALGILGAGGVVVPVNTRFKADEATYILRDSSARLVFTQAGFLDLDFVGMLRDFDAGLVSELDIVVFGGTNASTHVNWDTFLERAPLSGRSAALDLVGSVQGASASDILYTSGTTGRPKGVMLTHAQTLRAHGVFGERVGYQLGGASLIIPPFFHALGYKAGWMSSLGAGCTVIPQRKFDVDEALVLMSRCAVSVMIGPPTVFQEILDHPQRHKFDLSSWRSVCPTSAAVPAALVKRLRAEMQIERIILGYGLTESSAHATLTDPDDRLEDLLETSGRACPGVEVRVAQPDGGTVPDGERGEILIRGYNVMQGYWNRDEATHEKVTSDGWLHTGDIGTMDSRGFLKVVDRLSDMYVSGGFNVYPAEVERVLSGNPAVGEVAVVGVPDKRLGEVGAAMVRLVDGATTTPGELMSWCRERIAGFKVPQTFALVDQLPVQGNLKLDRRRIMADAKKLAASGEAHGDRRGRKWKEANT